MLCGGRLQGGYWEGNLMASSVAATAIVTGADYIASLRGRGLKVYFMGEQVREPVDHPVMRPSVNAVARTYDLAVENPELATAWSSLSRRRVNRFLHVTESVDDVVAQNKMQRRLGQLTRLAGLLIRRGSSVF